MPKLWMIAWMVWMVSACLIAWYAPPTKAGSRWVWGIVWSGVIGVLGAALWA